MEKIKKAIAIKYDSKEIAPKVVAKGNGFLAEKIISNNQNIPVFKDPDLLDELTKVNIGENIPPELYEVVAQVLIFISNLDKDYAKELLRN